MNYLLDSCALLWLTDNPRRLSEPARRAVSEPAAAVHVSAVSAWELGIKVARKKLRLPRPVSEWFAEVCRRYALSELPVTGTLAAKSTELPQLHSDPFDRLLVASALEFGLTVITPDSHLSKYPNLKTLW